MVGDRVLIDDLDLQLEAGQTLAVLGATGSGKSTLLRSLAWLHPLAAGELSLEGKSVATWGVCEWRRRVAYVPQQAPALPASADAHLQRVCEFRVQRRHGGVEDRRDRARALSRKWRVADASWQAEYSTLSGGERQRLYLAIVLATCPAVLLLDEPTSALDQTTKLLVERDLAGHTALWVTHDQEQARRVAQHSLELSS